VAGRSKTTIHRAIKDGRLSAARIGDGYEIDPAELERVFRPVTSDSNVPVERNVTAPDPVALTVEVTALRALAEERAETIRDLRARLHAAEARLDRLLLIDQRGKPEAPNSRRWWPWGRAHDRNRPN
jgi:nucleotide-binding universal stress UspA family protein